MFSIEEGNNILFVNINVLEQCSFADVALMQSLTAYECNAKRILNKIIVKNVNFIKNALCWRLEEL